jgi:hypothetical protein
MLQVREELMPKFRASVRATGTAHGPQACHQGRRARGLNLSGFFDCLRTAPNAASPTENRCEDGEHRNDDERLIAEEQIFVRHASPWSGQAKVLLKSTQT